MAEETTNKYITVAYKLFVTGADGISEMVEEATTERPFEFVSGMGLALDAFEAKVMPLGKGETFDFELSIDEGYGPYVEEGVQRLPRSVFEIDGRIDSRYIFEGAIVPLMNADGERFNATITRITPFGAFVQISPAVEALVHVSELGEGSDVDPEKIFTLNERKNFKVLDIDKEGRKISLSIAK